jgi:hypothetical protein
VSGLLLMVTILVLVAVAEAIAQGEVYD